MQRVGACEGVNRGRGSFRGTKKKDRNELAFFGAKSGWVVSYHVIHISIEKKKKKEVLHP